jgi:hypothetical protein
MHRLLIMAVALFAVVLALAATASAAAPTRIVLVRTLGPFVVDDVCDFPFVQTVERTRTTTIFDNGDEVRRVELVVTASANGKTWIDRDHYNVFVDAASPSVWVITGSFTHTSVAGSGTILLQSGRIVYDVDADAIVDLHEGPHATGADPAAYDAAVCSALGPTA